MAGAVLSALPARPAGFRAGALVREVPDTRLAASFDGEPMVQSFCVPLPDGRTGRCWITTAAALRVQRFGRTWVASQLEARAAAHGAETVYRELAGPRGLRLDA